MKILIVDDEKDIGFILGFELKTMGHESIAVETVQAAMEYLKAETPDAIICDFQMPRMSGLELFLWMKEQGIEIPFYILTGEPTMDINQLMEKGIKEILFKPQDLLRLSSIFK